LLADPKQFTHLLRRLHRHDWVVHVKPALGDPSQVLRYLGRYTHRVAISNHRLLSFDGERVTFRWKDYAHGSQQKKMTLTATEFLRRFFLHVLPKGFVRSATSASWPTDGGPGCSRSHVNYWAPNRWLLLSPNAFRSRRLYGAVRAAAPEWSSSGASLPKSCAGCSSIPHEAASTTSPRDVPRARQRRHVRRHCSERF
jgi:hypothetical protein